MRRLLVAAVAVAVFWAAPNAFAGTWCGSGETGNDRPDAVTGPQIHAIYVVPADGADTFAAGADELAADISSITTWWAGQDPTRIPRFDNAVFPAGTCTDISFVRIAQPGSAFSGSAVTAFTLLETELATIGYDDPYKKYLVYYGGPPPEDDVCGTGAGDFADGPSFAVVWLGGCPEAPDDAVAAHELLHALGALPAGAPNACTAADDPFGVDDPGHPCDSPLDVLYPASSGQPLQSLYLDYNHDDYYAHSGGWLDIQDSLWMHLLGVTQVPLALTIDGAGGVFSDLPGVICVQSCTTQWDPGSKVQLTAVPATGQRFIGWSGTCAGPGTCALSLTGAAAVTAHFGPSRVPFHLAIAGRGTVACTPKCRSTAAAGRPLLLRAKPAAGWAFLRWTGACKGTSPTCRPSTESAVSVRATFTKKPKAKKQR